MPNYGLLSSLFEGVNNVRDGVFQGLLEADRRKLAAEDKNKDRKLEAAQKGLILTDEGDYVKSPETLVSEDKKRKEHELGLLSNSLRSLGPDAAGTYEGQAIIKKQTDLLKGLGYLPPENAAPEAINAQPTEKAKGLIQPKAGALTAVPGYRSKEQQKLDSEERTRKFHVEDAYRKEFLGNTKDMRDVDAQFAKVKKAYENPSPAGDVAMIYGIMKMFDPGSTVREGEYATAANTGSIPQRLSSMYNRAIDGQRLTDDQRSDFFNTGVDTYQAQLDNFNILKNRYSDMSKRKGLNPADVVYDYQAPKKVDKATGGWTPEKQKRLEDLQKKLGNKK